MIAHERVDRLIRGRVIPRLDFMSPIGIHRRLAYYLAGQTDTAAELLPILIMAHIVETDFRGAVMSVVTNAHMAARLGPHWPDMQLESVPFGRSLAVIADGDRQEMVLNVRIAHASRRTDEAQRLELV